MFAGGFLEADLLGSHGKSLVVVLLIFFFSFQKTMTSHEQRSFGSQNTEKLKSALTTCSHSDFSGFPGTGCN